MENPRPKKKINKDLIRTQNKTLCHFMNFDELRKLRSKILNNSPWSWHKSYLD